MFVWYWSISMFTYVSWLRETSGTSFQTAFTPRLSCGPMLTSPLTILCQSPNTTEPWPPLNPPNLVPTFATSVNQKTNLLRFRVSLKTHDAYRHKNKSPDVLPFLRNLVHFLRTSDANIRLVYRMGLISVLSSPVKLLLVACWKFRDSSELRGGRRARDDAMPSGATHSWIIQIH